MKKTKLFTIAIVLLTSVTVMGVAAKHFWDVIIDNDLDVVGTIGGSGGGVSFDEFLNLQEESTPANPSASEHRVYFKSDGFIYKLNSAGIEKKIGGGGGGAAGINLLVEDNPGCEDGNPPVSWASTGGTFVAETSSPGFDLQSCSQDFSATGQFLRTAAKTIPDGLFGRTCSARIQYKWAGGTPGDITWKVEDSSDVLIAGSNDLAVSTDWVEDVIFFSCPSSGDMRIEFESTADAALVLIDNVELGQVGVASLSQTTLVAHAGYVQTSGCDWSVTNAAFTDFATVAACPAISVYASTIAVNTTDNDLPDIVFDSLPAGLYKVTSTFMGANSSTQLSGFRITDGTTSNSTCGRQLSTGHAATITCISTFEYTTEGARTFKLQGTSLGGATAQIFNGNNNGQGTNFVVEKFPTSSAEAVTLETVGEHWDVNIGGANVDLGVAALSSYTEATDSTLDMVINTGSKSAEIPCSTTNPSTGLTCSAGDESLGIVIDISTAGRYRACFQFSHFIDVDQSEQLVTTFQVIETPNNAQTILQEGNSRLESRTFGGTTSGVTSRNTFPINVCGDFVFSSAGQKTLRLMYEQLIGGTPNSSLVVVDRAAGNGQRDLHITVDKLDQQIPTPVFTDLTASLDSKVEHIDTANTYVMGTAFCSQIGTHACTINPGGFVDAITDTGVGLSTIDFKAGMFSSAPVCLVKGADSLGGSNHDCIADTISATQITGLRCEKSDDGVDVDITFHVICVGPK